MLGGADQFTTTLSLIDFVILWKSVDWFKTALWGAVEGIYASREICFAPFDSLHSKTKGKKRAEQIKYVRVIMKNILKIVLIYYLQCGAQLASASYRSQAALRDHPLKKIQAKTSLAFCTVHLSEYAIFIGTISFFCQKHARRRSKFS